MAIENLWPGNKAKGLLRAMYNIAVRRLNAGHPPERDQDVMPAKVDGHQEWVRIYGSAAPQTHWIRFAQSVAETLRAAAKIHPGEPVIFLALWRSPKSEDRIIHTWRIPAVVVDQMDAQLPAGIEEKNRNLTIRRYKNDGRWYWTGSGLQRIDLTNYYAPWNLDDDEMAYLKDLPLVQAKPGGPTRIVAHGASRTKLTTTFHPEYTYYDFVGSYKPIMAFASDGAAYTFDGSEKLPSGTPTVVYRFLPGVFISAVIQALNQPQRDVCLIIDEINRGNCAAIFGDVFQLLDRVGESGPEQGRSRYSIRLDPVILDYCSLKLDSEAIAMELREQGLRIPGNMHLLATMNTSDQSLFPMDSAFKRRWEWEYVPINYEQEEIQSRLVVIRTGAEQQTVPWVGFLRHVNRLVAEVSPSDDKQIGVYFVSLDADVLAARFLNKVLFYLWSDVFRHNPEGLFAAGIRSYDDLARRFLGGEWVFKAEFLKAFGVAGRSVTEGES